MRILWVNTVYGYPSYLEPGIPVFFIFKAKAPFTIVGSTCFNIFFFFFFYTSLHNSGRVLWFYIGRPCVCPSICRPLVLRPAIHFSFPGDNLSKHQQIFTKLGMCIDIVEIWFGIANGRILSNFDRVNCPNGGVL